MSAVEGEPGETGEHVAEAGDGHTHEQACLNCGVALVGEHCHACGQKAHVHRTLGAFWHDLLHGALHFEGKTWRTLPMLVWRPGELTRRYVEGERAKFVSPIALFLFSVFLMFAVFSSVGGPFGFGPAENDVPGQAAGPAPGPTTPETRGAAPANPAGAAAQQRRVIDLSDGKGATGVKWLDKAIVKWLKNPSLMLYKLQSNAYKFSWALIPISVPFLALLFLWRRRRQRLYDHTVFVTYSIGFATLLLIVLSFARAAGVSEDGVVLALTVIMPIHMFRQLKGAYQLRFFSALWRAAALTVFSVLAFLLFLALALALGAM